MLGAIPNYHLLLEVSYFLSGRAGSRYETALFLLFPQVKPSVLLMNDLQFSDCKRYFPRVFACFNFFLNAVDRHIHFEAFGRGDRTAIGN
jgi:hypothetical protein